MCAMAGIDQRPIAYLEAIIGNAEFSEEHTSNRQGQLNEKSLREETQGCPACILAALRQTRKYTGFSIDWKKESKEWYYAHRKEEPEESYP